MQVKLAVLADAVNLSADGKLNILGEFSVIWAAAFPAIHSRMFLVLKLEAEPGDAPRQRVRVRVVDEDSNPVGPGLEGEIDLGRPFRSGIPRSAPLMLEFRNAVFPRRGTYEFEIFLEEHRAAALPLYVFPSSERQESRPG